MVASPILHLVIVNQTIGELGYPIGPHLAYTRVISSYLKKWWLMGGCKPTNLNFRGFDVLRLMAWV